MALTAAAEPTWSLDSAAVGLAEGCSSCHGQQGEGHGALPRLAGRPREDLLRALIEYRDGRRTATVMRRIAKGYTVQELASLADHFAGLAEDDRD